MKIISTLLALSLLGQLFIFTSSAEAGPRPRQKKRQDSVALELRASLLQDLASPDTATRATAIKALSSLGKSRESTVILRSLDDPEPEVLYYVWEHFQKFPSELALTELWGSWQKTFDFVNSYIGTLEQLVQYLSY